MKISDRRLRISDSLKIYDFSNSLGVLQHPSNAPSNTPMPTHAPETGSRNWRHRPKFDARCRRQFFVPTHYF